MTTLILRSMGIVLFLCIWPAFAGIPHKPTPKIVQPEQNYPPSTVKIINKILSYHQHIVKALHQENVPYSNREVIEILAQMAHESGGNPHARGGKGEIGLMQLLPATAALMRVNPYDIYENILGCVRYRAHLRSVGFDGDRLLAAYNAGPGNVNKGFIPHKYIMKVNTWAKILGNTLT